MSKYLFGLVGCRDIHNHNLNIGGKKLNNPTARADSYLAPSRYSVRRRRRQGSSCRMPPMPPFGVAVAAVAPAAWAQLMALGADSE